MRSFFELQLSAVEIQIMAALLGYESVFGIKDEEFISREADAGRRIRQHVQRMEERKLIRYELDGTLYVDSELRLAMRCMCEAETIGIFSNNLEGKHNTIYVMGRENRFVYLERQETVYTISLCDVLVQEKIFPKIIAENENSLNETISLETVRSIRELLEAFESVKARSMLQANVNNPDSVNPIEKILSGKCGYVSGQIYKKGRLLYKLTGNRLCFITEGCVVDIAADEKQEVHINSVQPQNVIDRLELQMGYRKK